jgi:hemolysin-activating ACP:hemolysin acyltransferase
MPNFLPSIETWSTDPNERNLAALGVITLLDLMNPEGFTELPIGEYYIRRLASINNGCFYIFLDSEKKPHSYLLWETSDRSNIKCVTEYMYIFGDPIDINSFFSKYDSASNHEIL